MISEIKKWNGSFHSLIRAGIVLLMGLLHCPICIGLAVLSAIRFSAHAVMAYQLERGRAAASAHPATLLGTVFGL